MKKIFTLITLFAFLGGGNLYADEYTVTFKDCGGTSDSGNKETTIDGLIATGGSIFSEVAANNVFQARADRGVKLGSGSKPGSMEFTLSTKLNIQTIKFKARKYNDTETSITVNGKAFTELTGDFDEYTIELNGAETEKISISTPEKRAYITSLTILTPGEGGGGGGTTPEVWDASTADLEAIAANPVANDNDNFFVIPEETKLYPAGTYPNNSSIVVKSDGGVPAGLKNYILIGETASIKMTGTSTPNHDASANEGWQLKANGEKSANAGLNTDDCTVKFQKAIAPKNGNPSMSYKYYYEDKEDHSGTSARVSEDYWTPELKQMPLKGLYYEFETKAAGELLIGIRMNRETDQLYVFTKDDFAQLPTSALSIEGFVNNNTVVWGTNEKAMSTITMTSNHNYDHGKADIAEDYIEGFPTSKAVFGYLKLNVEANKTYVMLSPKAQPAIFGFQFTAGGDTGVETIKTEKVWNANAPMYNLSGQQVDKSYKGIVIQNGRKFVNK